MYSYVDFRKVLRVSSAEELIARANACDDTTFRSKYVSIPGYLKQWTADVGGLKGKRLLDFGCGNGTTACAVAATCEPAAVDGVDINKEHQECASLMRLMLGAELPGTLSFRTLSPGEALEKAKYDVVYSWSVFEHIDRKLLGPIIANIRESLVPNGVLFVQVAPLYYSAEGAHLGRYGLHNWEHLSLQLNKLRGHVLEATHIPETARKADWGCYETLNKITAEELVAAIAERGFKLLRRYETHNAQEPGDSLLRIYQRETLRTEQIVALFAASDAVGRE